MIKKFIQWYKRRSCKHSFVQIDSWYERAADVSYPVRMYECLKCGVHVKAGGPPNLH